MTLKEAFKYGVGKLQEAGIIEARQDSFYILEHVTRISREKYYADQHQEMSKEEQEDVIAFIHKRCERIPLQHIMGTTEFMGLPFKVNSQVLIPRQETELLVETALEVIKGYDKKHLAEDESLKEAGVYGNKEVGYHRDDEREELLILDMCTGSGCVLISTLCHGSKYFPKMRGVGVDISKEALDVARENALLNGVSVTEDSASMNDSSVAKENGISNSLGAVKITLVESDLFQQLEKVKKEDTKVKKIGYNKKYDIVLSNPPYIPSKEIESLQEEVKHHDPILALDGGVDGLHFYRQITKDCRKYLNRDGTLIVECGWNQGEEVSQIMKDHGFANVKMIKDLNGLDRVVVGNYG